MWLRRRGPPQKNQKNQIIKFDSFDFLILLFWKKNSTVRQTDRPTDIWPYRSDWPSLKKLNLMREGGPHFSNLSEIQKDINYPWGPNWEFCIKIVTPSPVTFYEYWEQCSLYRFLLTRFLQVSVKTLIYQNVPASVRN